ncbi:MAG: hypothetical protein HC913_12880 [Microscillaceae bacterium]|nr:hypothetical protein [Microscillaceae bacterium]
MSDAVPVWVLRVVMGVGLLHFLLISEVRGQEEGNFRLAFAPERVQYTDRAITSFGIEMEYFWSDNFSMAYRFALGRNSDEVVLRKSPREPGWLLILSRLILTPTTKACCMRPCWPWSSLKVSIFIFGWAKSCGSALIFLHWGCTTKGAALSAVLLFGRAIAPG